MHATYEQLLAIRDNRPVAAESSQHVNFCMLCRDRLDEMTGVQDELRQLPALQPQDDHWPDILERVSQQRNSSRRHRLLHRVAGIGLAASLVLAVTLYWLSGSHPVQEEHKPTLAGTATNIGAEIDNELATDAGDTPPVATTDEASLDQLIYQSRYLEAVLDSLPKRPRVMRAGTTDLITGLQDGVAVVDYQLNTGIGEFTEAQFRQLWQQRVDLMNSLVYVRAAEAQKIAYIPN